MNLTAEKQEIIKKLEYKPQFKISLNEIYEHSYLDSPQNAENLLMEYNPRC